MSQINAVNELITAINFDRFEEIEACHDPAVVFNSFRGPNLSGSTAVGDWHREFNRAYADLTYTEVEYVEQGNLVAVRTTLTAKGYDWRAFEQRALDVFELAEDEGVVSRRLYAMLRDIEFERAIQSAYTAARGASGGSASATKSIVDKFYAAVLAHDTDAMAEQLHEKCAIADSVFGIEAGPARTVEILESTPRPAFGVLRTIHTAAAGNAAVVELAYEPSRPRAAHWLRILDGKIAFIEVYWMLREIGVNPFEEYRQDRHMRKVIFPT